MFKPQCNANLLINMRKPRRAASAVHVCKHAGNRYKNWETRKENRLSTTIELAERKDFLYHFVGISLYQGQLHGIIYCHEEIKTWLFDSFKIYL